MTVFHPDNPPFGASRFEGMQSRQVIGPDQGAGAVTLGEVALDRGAELPLHRHRVEEAFYIAEGEGTLLYGDETHAVSEGDALLAPALQPHGFRNEASARLRVVFFYPAVEVWTEFI